MIEKYELAVIGAGPGGMQAALTAAEHGVHTLLIDSYPKGGGQYYMQPGVHFASAQLSKVESEGAHFIQRLNDSSMKTLFNTLVWGIFREEDQADWMIALYGPEEPYYIHARNLIIASGAYDTPIPFKGWTLPGVISCGASLIFLKSQRFIPGRKVVITGSGPLLLSAAAHFISVGAQVEAICETNRLFPAGVRHVTTMLGQGKRLREGVDYFWQILKSGVPYLTGWSILEAHGQDCVDSVTLTQLDGRGRPTGKTRSYSADLVVSGYSLTPNTGLARMIGCQMDYIPGMGGWVPKRNEQFETSLPGVFCIGDGAGIGGAENALLEGKIAAFNVAEKCGYLQKNQYKEGIEKANRHLGKQKQFSRLYADLFTLPSDLISLADDETIICRCEEVTLKEVKQAVSMGARTITEVKMITRTGMGNCQGRMCERSVSAAIVSALAEENQTITDTGYFSVRPPLHPLPANFLAKTSRDLE